MTQLFNTFIEAAVQEFGEQAAQLLIQNVKALLIKENPKKPLTFPQPVYQYTLTRNLGNNKLETRRVYVESTHLPHPRFLIELRDRVFPGFTGVTLMVIAGPAHTQPELDRAHLDAFHVIGPNTIEIPLGALTI